MEEDEDKTDTDLAPNLVQDSLHHTWEELRRRLSASSNKMLLVMGFFPVSEWKKLVTDDRVRSPNWFMHDPDRCVSDDRGIWSGWDAVLHQTHHPLPRIAFTYPGENNKMQSLTSSLWKRLICRMLVEREEESELLTPICKSLFAWGIARHIEVRFEFKGPFLIPAPKDDLSRMPATKAKMPDSRSDMGHVEPGKKSSMIEFLRPDRMSHFQVPLSVLQRTAWKDQELVSTLRTAAEPLPLYLMDVPYPSTEAILDHAEQSLDITFKRPITVNYLYNWFPPECLLREPDEQTMRWNLRCRKEHEDMRLEKQVWSGLCIVPWMTSAGFRSETREERSFGQTVPVPQPFIQDVVEDEAMDVDPTGEWEAPSIFANLSEDEDGGDDAYDSK
jgi:hypothetical protein